MKHTWALVPLHKLDRTKTRLEPVLDPASRRTLMLAMAEDVLAALTAATEVERILLVSNEPEAGGLLSAWPLEVFYSSDNEGLNRELEHAAAYAAARGAERVLIVHADLPWLSPEALDRFIAGCPAGGVCAAGCKLGSGTNALLAPLPLPLPLVFGKDSLQGFRDGAAAAGLKLQVTEDPHLSLDIDNPEDFERLFGAPHAGRLPGPSTRHALQQMVGRRVERIA